MSESLMVCLYIAKGKSTETLTMGLGGVGPTLCLCACALVFVHERCQQQAWDIHMAD